MKLPFLFVIFVLSIHIGTGQPGFMKWFDFASRASFHNVILTDDTLIIAGTAKDLATNQWGALFVKMDTLGNILDYKLHLDTLDGQYAFAKGYPFISTEDGGYLLAGKVFNRESYFLFKLNASGGVIFFKEYPEPADALTVLPMQIVETIGGSLILTDKQLLNGKIDVQVTKIDPFGEVLWEKSHGEYETNERVTSIWVADENTFVIGCSKEAGPPPVPSPIDCLKNWIFAIDSLGIMKWEWAGEPCEGDLVKGLQQTPDGGWIYATRQPEFFDQWNWGAAPKFVKRDSNFNLQWERQVAESYWDNNYLIDLKATPEGHWVGTGAWVLPEPFLSWSNDFQYTPGCLYKVTGQGDSLWLRCDTVTLDNHTLFHRPGGMVVLPSGSIVSVGSFIEELPGLPDKEWAWVVKVDKNGCMDEPCTILGAQELNPKDSNVWVYPNPATDWVHIETREIMTAIRVINVQGEIMKEWKPLSEHKTLNLSGLAEGLYLLEIQSENKQEVKMLIKRE